MKEKIKYLITSMYHLKDIVFFLLHWIPKRKLMAVLSCWGCACAFGEVTLNSVDPEEFDLVM